MAKHSSPVNPNGSHIHVAKTMLNVTFVLTNGMLSTGTSLPIEMLKAATSNARSQDRGCEIISVTTAAITDEPVETVSEFRLQAAHTLDQVSRSDIIYLPGLWRNPRPIIRRSQALIEWIRYHYEHGATFAAVGTGCCFLAEAGLLDQRPATTHWHYFDQFQRDYPAVQLKRQHFITQAGNLYCAASVNSLADLTVYFIRRFYGQQIATQVERHFSHEIRRPFEAVCYFEDKPERHADEEITQIQMWLQDNFSRDITMQRIAERFDLSTRTLNRRFRQATGKTPLEYLQGVRIDVGRDLLKTSNLSVTEIAYRVGYQDASHFSSLFKARLAITPSEYRTTVRAKLFSSTPAVRS